MRLAATQSHAERIGATAPQIASSQPSAAPPAAPAQLNIQLSPRSQPEVSQMVWTSVLESLSSATAAVSNAAGIGSQPVMEPDSQPASVPLYAPQPSIAQYESTPAGAMSELFTPAAVRMDFATLIPDVVAAPPEMPTIVPAAQAAVVAVPEPAVHPAAHLVADQPQYSAVAVAEAPIEPVVAMSVSAMEVIVPAMPTLAPPVRVAPAPKPTENRFDDDDEIDVPAKGRSKAKSGKTPTVAKSPKKAPPVARTAPRRKERHPFRSFIAFILIVGILGGAGYAGWYYILRKQVQWAEDVKPLATFVEDTTGKEFMTSVDVVTLSPPEYEVKLGIDQIASTYPDLDGSFAALRAVGLSVAQPSATYVGQTLSYGRTAFYSGADQHIYRLAGSTPVFQASLIEALTMALADQHLGWSADEAPLNDSVRIGLQNQLDTLADGVLRAKLVAEPAFETELLSELDTRRAGRAAGLETPLFVAAVRPGLDAHLSAAVIATTDPIAGIVARPSDGSVFDSLRVADTTPIVPTAPSGAPGARTMGMLFWYTVLSNGLSSAARPAALLWQGDSTEVSSTAGRACLNANISTSTVEDQTALVTAFNQWAVSRPASTTTTITALPANVVQVSTCEATEVAPTPPGDDRSFALVLGAANERSFLLRAQASGLPASPEPTKCAVTAFRSGIVANFAIGTTDQTVQTAISNVVTFCTAPVAPAPAPVDPAATEATVAPAP
jgi:hypothetical protein